MQLRQGLQYGLLGLFALVSTVAGFLYVPTKNTQLPYQRLVLQAASDDGFVLPGVVVPSTRAPSPPSPSPPPPRPFPGGGRGGRDFNRKGEEDKDVPLMNEQLVRNGPKEIRLIIHGGDEGDEMAGVVSTADAFQRASEMGLDLIMISETAKPPVCKIIDYGKYRYSVEKKKKEQKKKAKTTEVKEVKMSYKIEAHDYGVRLKQIARFLEDGDRVKVMIQFRGREQQHIDLGMEMLTKIQADTKEIAALESEIKREGGRLMAMFKPRPR